jgi:hypothetical protein
MNRRKNVKGWDNVARTEEIVRKKHVLIGVQWDVELVLNVELLC